MSYFFFLVMHQISRSHRLKNWRFKSNLSKITRPVAAIKSLRFALFKVIRQISRSHGSKNRPIWPRLGVSRLWLQFEFTNGYEMMHKAWSSIEEVPYCFSRSSVKFQGHMALKIVKFDPNWAFPDCNSSFNTPMVTKWCTKHETAKERYPIVFQGHPSNFKVTRDKTSLILTQIGRFRTIGRWQLSNPSDLPCSRSNTILAISQGWLVRLMWNKKKSASVGYLV